MNRAEIKKLSRKRRSTFLTGVLQKDRKSVVPHYSKFLSAPKSTLSFVRDTLFTVQSAKLWTALKDCSAPSNGSFRGDKNAKNMRADRFVSLDDWQVSIAF